MNPEYILYGLILVYSLGFAASLVLGCVVYFNIDRDSRKRYDLDVVDIVMFSLFWFLMVFMLIVTALNKELPSRWWRRIGRWV